MTGGTGKEQGAVVVSLDCGRSDEASQARTIAQGLRDGAPWAADALYELVGDHVNRVVWRMLGPDSQQSDVVHDVFVNVISSLNTLKQDSALRSWVVGVAVNTVRRELRRRKYRRLVSFEADADRIAEGSTDLFTQRFYEVLGRLPAKERIPFVLHYFEGHGVAEIGKICGYSVATTKRRLASARATFRKYSLKEPILASVVGEGPR